MPTSDASARWTPDGMELGTAAAAARGVSRRLPTSGRPGSIIPVPADPPTHRPSESVPERARAYFEAFAADYDAAATEAGWEPNELLAGALADVGPVRTALDLACGTGSTLAVVRRAFPDAGLTGVDLAGGMLERARATLPDARHVHQDIADFAAAGARAGERFDLVTCIGGLEFTEDLPGVLEDVRRLVRPGGHLVITYEPVVLGWEPQALRAETNLGSNGLGLTTIRWEPGEVTAGFAGWREVSNRLVVAYQRDGLPTIYGWLQYQRPA